MTSESHRNRGLEDSISSADKSLRDKDSESVKGGWRQIKKQGVSFTSFKYPEAASLCQDHTLFILSGSNGKWIEQLHLRYAKERHQINIVVTVERCSCNCPLFIDVAQETRKCVDIKSPFAWKPKHTSINTFLRVSSANYIKE